MPILSDCICLATVTKLQNCGMFRVILYERACRKFTPTSSELEVIFDPQKLLRENQNAMVKESLLDSSKFRV